MSEHVRDSGQVGRETVLRPRGAPVPILAEGTAPITAILAEGTAPYPIPVAQPAVTARRIWPWLAGALVLAGSAVTGYLLLAQRSERAAIEERFPTVVDAGERSALEDEAGRWNRGKDRLLATLTRFTPPALDTLTGAGACPLEIDPELAIPTTDDPDAAAQTRVIVMPGESLDGLDALARDEIERMIAASERGRFRTDEGKTRVLRAIRGAFVVAMITEHQAPGLDRAGAIRPGTAAGVAYAFDPATGALRCAGSFRSTSDEASFESATVRAVSSSLRAID
ncbi:MAG: hypothetical protein H0T42_20510 [Deltaproteobacteria bacterium]|nr:hypothetical protein [Deltaproteobacteria bacterium]